MTPLQFLRSHAATEVFERAYASSAIPISVHFISPDHEGPSLAGCGACGICAHVAALPGGKRACRDSRMAASLAALESGRPVTFLCHMKFMCVSASVLSDTLSGLVATLGPYCPAEAREGLAIDAQRGFEALEGVFDATAARSLDELTIVRATSPASLAEWIRSEISTRWGLVESSESDKNDVEEFDLARSTHGVDQLPTLDPFGARTIALALAAGHGTRARAKAVQILNDGQNDILSQRLRALALGFAVLEAAAGRAHETGACWARKDSFLSEVQDAAAIPEFADALSRLWRPLQSKGARKRVAKGKTPRLEIAGLDEIVSERLSAGVALNDVAKVLGVHPTTITHRLQRNFGVSFSQYVARMRLDKAKELLRRTHLSVRDVAVRVGIDDASNFTKLFKRFEHMSPMEYRDASKRRR
jgi:AraC-like DNA-binding protein